MTTPEIRQDMSEQAAERLAKPEESQGPIEIRDTPRELLRRFLHKMQLIRRSEEHLGDMVEAGIVVCPCHLGIGQEAVAVGVSGALKQGDRVFGAHRSHPHFLALNDDVFGLFAETLGKAEGCSGGMGGSMHLVDRKSGFYGSVPIVAGTVPVAAGAGLASKLSGDGTVSVSYFGDGATEEGGVQETLNAAATMKLPVVFVCENNLFSSHMHISLRQPHISTARFAKAHGIPYEVLDGNDIVMVYQAMLRAADHARQGRGPYFLETFTYRWRGHVGFREDEDVGVKRKDDLHLWKMRDPIQRLREAMIEADMLQSREWDSIVAHVDEQVANAWQRAESSPFPPEAALLNLVYAPTGRETKEQ